MKSLETLTLTLAHKQTENLTQTLNETQVQAATGYPAVTPPWTLENLLDHIDAGSQANTPPPHTHTHTHHAGREEGGEKE